MCRGRYVDFFNVVSALGQSYSDLTFKVVLNVPTTTQAYLVDNLRFVGASSETTVSLNVSDVDDFFYVTVNGLRRQDVPWGGVVSSLDISDWFVPGANEVRVQLADTGGDASYDVEILVDGVAVVDEACVAAPCAAGIDPGPGIVFDETYSINTPGRPLALLLVGALEQQDLVSQQHDAWRELACYAPQRLLVSRGAPRLRTEQRSKL